MPLQQPRVVASLLAGPPAFPSSPSARLYPLWRKVDGHVAGQARGSRFAFLHVAVSRHVEKPRPVSRAYAPTGVVTLPHNG